MLRSSCAKWAILSLAAVLVTAAFVKATQNVQAIGLSFGGLCFFETGVTPTPDTFTNEQFSSTFSES